MNDLLTKEEREHLDRIRYQFNNIIPRNDNTLNDDDGVVAYNAVFDLLTIIDNLSKRGVKKYSTEELRLVFLKQIEHRDWIANDGRLGRQYDEWLKCARFLGALEEEQ